MKAYWGSGGIAPLILWPRHWMEVIGQLAIKSLGELHSHISCRLTSWDFLSHDSFIYSFECIWSCFCCVSVESTVCNVRYTCLKFLCPFQCSVSVHGTDWNGEAYLVTRTRSCVQCWMWFIVQSSHNVNYFLHRCNIVTRSQKSHYGYL
jgi:hypothetical protein